MDMCRRTMPEIDFMAVEELRNRWQRLCATLGGPPLLLHKRFNDTINYILNIFMNLSMIT